MNGGETKMGKIRQLNPLLVLRVPRVPAANGWNAAIREYGEEYGGVLRNS